MAIKLSQQKITRLLRMYLQGFTQVAIAEKTKVNQATVSLYANEFTAMVDEEGLEAAAKEYGQMDVVKELHSLGAELKKSKLCVEDAKKGLKVAVALEDCGVPQDGYKNVINACIKMNDEGFLLAAMELHKIEESSGKSCKEIVKEASNAQTQTQQAKKELSATQEKVGIIKQTLAALLQQQASVGKDLQQQMQKSGSGFREIGEDRESGHGIEESRHHGQGTRFVFSAAEPA